MPSSGHKAIGQVPQAASQLVKVIGNHGKERGMVTPSLGLHRCSLTPTDKAASDLLHLAALHFGHILSFLGRRTPQMVCFAKVADMPDQAFRLDGCITTGIRLDIHL